MDRAAMIAIVDYRVGNVGSIANMIVRVGGKALVTSDSAELRRADKLILPGVGHFDRGMMSLEEMGLIPTLNDLVLNCRVPVLGICLGMQLMCRSSEEGQASGLSWLDASVHKFDTTRYPSLKVPHMGWNTVSPARESYLLDMKPPEPQRFYFVHSYHVECHQQEDVLATTSYGHAFCSVFMHENIIGVQFHPEKSHAFGMELFRRFLSA